MQPIISLIYLTYRPGGFDLLVESLRHQAPVYDLVVVDDYPGRLERGETVKYIKDNGINLTWYGPSKPHSYPEQKKNGLANAMNTGAIHSRCNYLVFLHDFVWLPPGAMMEWVPTVQRFHERTLLSGVASMQTTREPEKQGDVSVWYLPQQFCGRAMMYTTEEWAPLYVENFYLGMPVQFLEQTNGIDERSDCGHIAWAVQSMAKQAVDLKWQMIVSRNLRVNMVNHRLWKKKVDNPELWHAEQMSELKVLTNPPTWQSRSPNPFDFQELRGQYLSSLA